MGRDRAVRTRQEYELARAFDRLNIPYLINRIFCFTCKSYYEWKYHSQPEQCLNGHKWTEKGEYARPDFILLGKNDAVGIVRVDGQIHDLKKHMIADAWQVRNFHRSGCKVFIVKNEHLDGFEIGRRYKRKNIFPAKVPDYVILAIAQFFWDALNDDKIYDVYLNDKEVRIWLGLKAA